MNNAKTLPVSTRFLRAVIHKAGTIDAMIRVQLTKKQEQEIRKAMNTCAEDPIRFWSLGCEVYEYGNGWYSIFGDDAHIDMVLRALYKIEQILRPVALIPAVPAVTVNTPSGIRHRVSWFGKRFRLKSRSLSAYQGKLEEMRALLQKQMVAQRLTELATNVNSRRH